MATLYVVATPIGNKNDISRRAYYVLSRVRLIVAENPRASQVILKPMGAAGTIVSYFGRDKHVSFARPLGHLGDGQDVALVSQAGTPGINDPGGQLVAAARAAGHRVVPIPGPNAAIAAASVSGFPMDQFVFKGFAPHKKGRQTFFDEILQEKNAVILYESPHRVRKTMQALAERMPDRYLCVARELTKIHEQIVVDRVSVIAALSETDVPSRGEFVLVLAPQGFSPQD